MSFIIEIQPALKKGLNSRLNKHLKNTVLTVKVAIIAEKVDVNHTEFREIHSVR